jgi:hypothetical protein
MRNGKSSDAAATLLVASACSAPDMIASTQWLVHDVVRTGASMPQSFQTGKKSNGPER